MNSESMKKPSISVIRVENGRFRAFCLGGKWVLTCLICILTANYGLAQKSIADSCIGLGFINITYSAQLPEADLVKRYGFTNFIGGETGYKLKNNFYFYTGAKLLFGNVVKERIAGNITYLIGDSTDGFVTMAIGNDGRYYQVRFFERGFTIPFMAGKIFPVFKKSNPNSGIYVEAGFQFIQHKVKIEVVGSNVASLDKPLKKGYDRLTTGMGLVQGFGYRFLSSKRLTNFYVGFEISENFTRSRRSINVDTGISETEPRLDILYGIKVGWSFPIYNQASDRIYY